MPTKTLKLIEEHELIVLISIQSTQDKIFSCLLTTVLFTIISIIMSTILKLHVGLLGFFFLGIICLHEFMGGYPFFSFCCGGMSKQNHREEKDQCIQQMFKYPEQVEL